MDAISFLYKEHNKVRKTLAEINKKTARFTTKRKKFDLLAKDLIRHERMEHKVWYPHLKNKSKIKNEIKHLLSEEKHAEMALKKIKTIRDEEAWLSFFLKIKNEIEKHAKEEETKLFPWAHKILDDATLLAIGKKMKAFKDAYRNKSH